MLAHDDEAIGKCCDFIHHHALTRVRFAQNRVQSGYYSHLQPPQQPQDVATGRTTKNAVLMLKRNEVNVAEIQEIGSIFIGGGVSLGEFESNSRRIAVVRSRIVDWYRQQLSTSVLGADGVAQVCRKGCNSALPREVISDHRYPARQGRT